MRTLLALCLIAAVGSAAFFYRDSFRCLHDPMASGRGVVFYDKWRAQPGYNFVEVFALPYGRPRCRIMDMNGKVLLTIPGSNCELLDDGGVASDVDGQVVRRDRNLNVVWRAPKAEIRHDIHEDPATHEIFYWTEAPTKVTENLRFSNTHRFLGRDFVINELIGVDRDGRQTFRWNAYEHLEDMQEVCGDRNRRLDIVLQIDQTYEFTHFNSIDVLPENRWSARFPAFKKGNLLVASTTCGCLAIISRETGKIVWHHQTRKAAITKSPRTARPDNYRTHSAHWLQNGDIIFYQNSREDDAPDDQFAEAIEINPTTHDTVWSYRADKSGRFFGDHLGGVYRLANGNTLISSLANQGNIFEITPEGRLVWEWNNSEKNIFPGLVYRARRVSPEQVRALLAVPHTVAVGMPDPFYEP